MLELLPHLCYTADAVTRDDLRQSLLVDERAYIATWMARTRDLWRLAGFSSSVVVRQPMQNFEVTFGVDAIIAINLGGLWKFLAVEAKRPGFSKARRWDQVKSVNEKRPAWSRFSRQIMKQSLLAHYGWLVGGLFIDERPHHAMGYDPLGCSFLPHAILANGLLAKKVSKGKPGRGWTTKDILGLLGTGGNPHPGNIRQALELLIACKVGDPMTFSQTRSMTQAIEEMRGELVPMEREFLGEDFERREEPERPELYGRSVVSMALKEPEPGPPVSEDLKILKELVEATGAAHGVVFSLPDVQESLLIRDLWREKNEKLHPTWGR